MRSLPEMDASGIEGGAAEAVWGGDTAVACFGGEPWKEEFLRIPVLGRRVSVKRGCLWEVKGNALPFGRFGTSELFILVGETCVMAIEMRV